MPPLIDWIIPLRLVDLVEIGLVAFVLYQLYRLMRGTIAVSIFLGLVALFLIQVVVQVLDMIMLSTILGAFSDVFVLAVIVLFQPELRRLLLLLGQNPLIRRFVATPVQEELVGEVTDAVRQMSEGKIGALMAFERSTGLRSWTETGTPLQARVSSQLLVTIFYAQNPLHDGAVIIRGRTIEAAQCILPLTTNRDIPPHFGLRHRAALGLSEQTDAFVVVTSEETGSISVAQNGQLYTGLSPEELGEALEAALAQNRAPAAEVSAEV